MARILVAEDDPDNLELITYLLKAFGHETLEAHDGAQALELAQREPPDLVLMDIQMPVMDGYEAVRHLQSDRVCEGTPILAITALAMVGDRDKILQAGFDGYISKPIDPESFVQELNSHLVNTAGAAPRRAAPLRTGLDEIEDLLGVRKSRPIRPTNLTADYRPAPRVPRVGARLPRAEGTGGEGRSGRSGVRQGQPPKPPHH
jgi:two-component system cell cycle response regulator